MIHECEKLPQEILDEVNKTFETHLGIDGLTGHGYQPEFRKTECRYCLLYTSPSPRDRG